jgi:glycosyltransferase involved in cell wall biosynthesis
MLPCCDVQHARLRIGLVSFAWTEQHNGGLRSHVRDMAHKLSELGGQVHVFCVNTDPTAKPFETCGWSEGPIQIQAMNYAYYDLPTFFDFQHVPQAGVVLCEWAQRLQLDVVDIHHNLFIGMSVIPQLAAITPTAVTLHDYWPLDPRGQLFPPDHQPRKVLSQEQWEGGAQRTWPNVFERSQVASGYYQNHRDRHPPDLQAAWVNYSIQCLSASQLLITPSQASADIFQANSIQQPIRVIENGIDTSCLNNGIRNERLSPPPPSSKLRLALLGNIAPSKGQLAFCEACVDSELRQHLDVHLYGSCPPTYHGDPTPQEALLELCEQHPDTLHLHGAYQREDLIAIFERSDLVAMPSLWQEVYGLIAREALCYGLPLIISNAGGLKDLSSRSRVLTLNHLAPQQWSDQLKQWLVQCPLRDWVAYRRLHIPPCDNDIRSSDQCAAELLSTYQQLIRAHK